MALGDTVKFRLTIAYDGTAYEGWQVQKIGLGVQQKVEEALAKLFPSQPRVHSSSRTDTGVHALGMVAHFEVPRSECTMTARKLALAVNAWLPEDVRVLSATRTRAEFHARFDATGKQYRYFIWNHPGMNPLGAAISLACAASPRSHRHARRRPTLHRPARFSVVCRQPRLCQSHHRADPFAL